MTQAADSLMAVFGYKRVKPRKLKRSKLPTLITKADGLASEYIRRKHADPSGYVTCISCPKVLHWKEAHCAHFIGRAAKGTRWLEENLHVACPSCNVYRKELHMREYTLAMADMYGRDFIENLKVIGKQVLSASQVRELAEAAIEYYGAQLKEKCNEET